MSENVLSVVFAGIRLTGQDPKVFLESGFNLGKSFSCVREELLLGFGQVSEGSKKGLCRERHYPIRNATENQAGIPVLGIPHFFASVSGRPERAYRRASRRIRSPCSTPATRCRSPGPTGPAALPSERAVSPGRQIPARPLLHLHEPGSCEKPPASNNGGLSESGVRPQLVFVKRDFELLSVPFGSQEPTIRIDRVFASA